MDTLITIKHLHCVKLTVLSFVNINTGLEEHWIVVSIVCHFEVILLYSLDNR